MRYLIFLSACLGLGSACTPAETSRPAKPNFIVILADDLGISDLGCYGNDFIETPHLDRLAREGMRFTQAYAAAPLCSPTRASLVTGLNPARINLTEHIHGHPPTPPTQRLVTPKIEQGLPLAITTTAELMAGQGYFTAHLGKWHLGGGDFSPEHQGYAKAFGGSWAGLPGSFFYPFWPGGAYPELRENASEGDYLPDVLTDEALRFLQEQRDTSFFLALNFYAPHVPIEGKDSLVAYYRQKRGGDPDSLLPNVHYAAMVAAIDQNLGRLMARLRSLELDQNTVVVFTSDNGGLHVEEVPGFDQHTPPTSNEPYRAGKGYLYEGGIREPLMVWGPGLGVKQGETEALATTDDLFNTLADWTGDTLRSPDGQSWLPLLTGAGPWKDRALHWHFPHYSPQGGLPGAVIRQGNYKLIEWYETGEYALYDLASDPGEQQNLAASDEQRVQAMAEALAAWREEVGAQMPRLNPAYRPAIGQAGGR